MRAFITSFAAALLIATSAIASTAPRVVTLNLYGHLIGSTTIISTKYDKYPTRQKCETAAAQIAEDFKPQHGIIVDEAGKVIQLVGYTCVPDGWPT
jgi:hypothetical protein